MAADALALTIERTPLLDALKIALNAVDRKGSIPILGNFLLAASGSTLQITGTNLDQEVTAYAPAEVSIAGGATVQAEPLKKIVERMPASAVVSIATAPDGRTTVSAGRARFQLPTLPVDQFPIFKIGDSEQSFEFNVAGSIISEVFRRGKFAISSEETRYYLNGTYMHAVERDGGETTLRCVSTDGHRLARIDTARVSGLQIEMPGVIVPRKMVELIETLGKEAGAEPVTIAHTTRTIRASAGGTSIASKLIDGTFPDYVRVIPTDFPREAVAPTLSLIETISRVGVMADDKQRSVKCTFDEEKISVTLRNASDGGEAHDELDLEYTGEAPFSIGFNSSFLADILAHVGSDTVRVRLGATNIQPLVVMDKTDEGLFVLMPTRIN